MKFCYFLMAIFEEAANLDTGKEVLNDGIILFGSVLFIYFFVEK